MRSVVVSEQCDGSNSGTFEDKLNKVLIGLENKNLIPHSIKYAVATRGTGSGTMIYSAVILYDEVPTRTVITEKAEQH